jgi:hypothetical protein
MVTREAVSLVGYGVYIRITAQAGQSGYVNFFIEFHNQHHFGNAVHVMCASSGHSEQLEFQCDDGCSVSGS